jgi:hypothetical protein
MAKLPRRKFTCHQLTRRYTLDKGDLYFELSFHHAWNTIVLEIDKKDEYGIYSRVELSEDRNLMISNKIYEVIRRVKGRYKYFVCFGHYSEKLTWKKVRVYIRKHFNFDPIMEAHYDN